MTMVAQNDSIEFKQHWFAFVGKPWLALLIMSLLLRWLAAHPQTIPLHNTVIEIILSYSGVLILIAIAFALLSLGSWGVSKTTIAENQIIHRVAFNEERIPIYALQDVRVTRSFCGVLLGYGTITLDSGRQEEILTYVPSVDDVVSMLNPWRRR